MAEVRKYLAKDNTHRADWSSISAYWTCGHVAMAAVHAKMTTKMERATPLVISLFEQVFPETCRIAKSLNSVV